MAASAYSFLLHFYLHILFCRQYALLHVLAAYSVWNEEVGYCQGMSHIAALLLMYVEDEMAFWCLDTLMRSPRHYLHGRLACSCLLETEFLRAGFFSHGFPKLQYFEEHFKHVLKKHLLKVSKRFEKLQMQWIFLPKWFMGCFLDRVRVYGQKAFPMP